MRRLLFVFACLFLTASAYAQPYFINGTVTDSNTTDPISGVQLDFNDSGGDYVGSAFTDGSGNYSFEVPTEGDYIVFTPIYGIPVPYLPQVWPDLYCDFQVCDINGTSSPVSIAGGDANGIDFVLETGFTMSGTIRDAGTSNPIEGVSVCVHRPDGSFTGACGVTGVSGDYQTTALPAGTDYVPYAIPDDQGYRRQVYSGQDCFYTFCDFGTGTPLELGNPGSVVDIDFDLNEAATISGTVTDSGTGLGVPPQVRLHDTGGNQLFGTNGETDGTYVISGIDPGTYYVLLNNRDGPLIDELYDDVKCPRLACDFTTLGTPITLTSGEIRTGIDAALDPGSRIGGAVTLDGEPVSFLSLSIYDASGTLAGFAFTDGSGNYQSRSGLPAGTYYLATTDPESETGVAPVAWPGTPCGEPCDPLVGEPIVVNGVDDVGGIDLALTSPTVTSISGNISGSDTALGLEGIIVWLFDLQCNFLAAAGTDVNGDYLVQAPGAGNYYLFAIANDTLFINQQTPYMNQQYPGINVIDTCEPNVNDVTLGEVLGLAEAEQATGIDFVLEPGGEILGTISDSSGVLANESGVFRLYKTDGQQQYLGLNKEPDGSYRFGGILPGSYWVVLASDGLGLIDERYDDFACPRNSCDPADGTVFTFTGTESFTGVDAVLSAGAVVRGTVTDADGPVANFCVYFYTATGVYAAIACTDELGNFETSTGLPDGQYRMSNQLEAFTYRDVIGDYTPQVWTNDGSFQACGSQCDFLLGDTFTVSGLTPVEGIDLEMQAEPATLTGTVVDSSDGTTPVHPVDIDLLDPVTGETLGIGVTNNPDGTYEFTDVAPGEYKLIFNAYGAAENYRDELFDEFGCNNGDCDRAAEGDSIVLGAGVNTIDEDLVPVNVRGTLTLTGGVPAGTVGRVAVVQSGELISFIATETSGYWSAQLPPGDYNFFFRTLLQAGPFVQKGWNGSPEGVVCPFQGGFGFLCDVEADLSLVSIGGPVVTLDMEIFEGIFFEGSVKDSDTLADVNYESIQVWNGDDTFYFAIPPVSGSSGEFMSTAIPANNYFAATRSAVLGEGYLDEFWNDVPCEQNTCDPAVHAPTLITPAPGDTVRLDFEIDLGTTISGTITAEDGGALLSDIKVCVGTPTYPEFTDCEVTDVNGLYAINGLVPLDDYVVYTEDVGGQAFFREAYDNQPCCNIASGTPVTTVSADAVIDLQLVSSGRIAGFVSDVVTDLGIGNVAMRLYDETCQQVDVIDIVTDDGDFLGNYAFSGVSDGIYYVYADGSQLGYVNELYPNEQRIDPCFGDYPAGQAIVIENKTLVSGIDFELDPGGSISGFVSDSNGVLGSRAGRMFLSDSDGNLIKLFFNDQPDNSYVASGLPPGSYQVDFSSRRLGLIDERYDDIQCPRRSCDTGLGEQVVVGPLENVTGIDATLEPGAVISGRLTDAETGVGLPFQFISFYDSQGRYVGLGVSNSEGIYTAETGLPPGDYFASNQFVDNLRDIILPVSNGYLPQAWTDDGSFGACGEPCDVLLGDPITIADTSPVENIDMAMELGSSISGNVQFDGSPLAEATVVLLDELAIQIRSTLTDTSGNYSFAGLSSGDYYVRTLNSSGYEDRLHREPIDVVCNPDCNPFAGSIIALAVSSEVSGIDFTLAVSGSLSGTVTDSGVNPLTGITVETYNSQGELVGTDLTSASGEFAIGGLGTATYYVRTRNTQGYFDRLYNSQICGVTCDVILGTGVPVSAGVNTSNIDFTLIQGGTIAGTLLGDSGVAMQSLSGSKIELYNLQGLLIKTAISDSNDTYRFDGLAPGDYYVVTRNLFKFKDEGAGGEACPPGCDILQTTPVSVTEGISTLLNFLLEFGGSIPVFVTNESNFSLAGITAIVSATDGTEVGRVVSGSVNTTVGGASFNGEITGLPPGKYYVHVETASIFRDEVYDDVICDGACNPLVGAVVTVGTGAVNPPIPIALKVGSSISGTLTDQGSGDPIPSMPVTLFRNGMSFRTVTSDAAGNYTFTGLVDGTYQVKTNGTTLPYINQVFGGADCSPGACPIADGTEINLFQTDTSGIDFSLAQGGTIFGYARDPNNQSIRGTAYLLSSTGETIASRPDIYGSFTFAGIAEGSYFVLIDAISRPSGTGRSCHYHYSGFRRYRHCNYYTLYSTSVDTLYSGISCPGLGCDRTSGTPIVLGASSSSGANSPMAQLNEGQSKVQGVTQPSVNIEIEVQSGHNIRGSVKSWDNKPLAVTRVYFFTADGTPAGIGVTDGEGNYVSESAFTNGTYYAATSRAAIPGEDMLDALDAVEGVPEKFAEQIWSGVTCEGVCAPGPANGTAIVIDGADATGIDFVLSQAPGIALEKLTNGVDADTPNGGEAPQIEPGATVTWTYQLTNTGGEDLQNIVVTDDQGVMVSCPQSTLDSGASIDCTASAPAENLASEPFTGVLGNCAGMPDSRLYQNTGSVTAETAGAVQVDDTDTSHYCNPDLMVEEVIFSSGFE